MSAEGETITLDAASNAIPAEPWDARRVWKAVETGLERIGDRLNPILVKETRQALKSRQFLITFTLLLFLGWGWSILGVTLMGPNASMGNYGSDMFMGYFIILAFPLLVVVPFGAFRSLAAEQETRTYELLSITALGTRQIIIGKLGSAVMQMSVYLSAVSPCLGFTYLLRGIDLLSIFIIIFWLSIASLGLSAIALLMATVTSKKAFQAIPMVGSMLGFFYAFGLSIAGMSEFLREGGGRMAMQWEFWAINGALLTGFAAYFLMVCEASAARLSFPSDNRSTRLRVIMVLHQMLFTGWMVVPWMHEKGGPEIYLAFMIPAGIQWYFLGAMMIGEFPKLSGRVKRQLPSSFLGRMFLTWFFPGPACGYALALTGLLCALCTVGIGMILSKMFGWSSNVGSWSWRTNLWDHILPFGILGLSYITIYLGLGLLILRAIRRVTFAGILLSVLMQVFMLLGGCLIPLIIQLSSQSHNSQYTLLQITNPFWTLSEVAWSRTPFTLSPDVLTIVPIAAIIVFLINLPGLIREIRNLRIYKPQRVIEEDANPAFITPIVVEETLGDSK